MLNPTETQILKYGAENGMTREQIITAIGRYRTGAYDETQQEATPVAPQAPAVQQPVAPTDNQALTTGVGNLHPDFSAAHDQTINEPGYIDRVTSAIKQNYEQAGNKWDEIAARTDMPIWQKIAEMSGQAAKLGAGTIEAPLTQAPVLRDALDATGRGIGWLANTAPVQAVANKVSNIDAFRNVVDLYDTDKDFRDTVDSVGNMVRLGGDASALMQSAAWTKNVVGKLNEAYSTAQNVGAAAKAAGAPETGIITPGEAVTPEAAKVTETSQLQKLIDEARSRTSGTVSQAQDIMSGNIREGLQAKSGEGAMGRALASSKRLDNAPELYDQYYKQALAAGSDTLEGHPVENVGIDSAFKKVLQLKKDAGAVVGSELDKIASTPVDVKSAMDDFMAKLESNGISVKKNTLVSSAKTPFAKSDMNILQGAYDEIRNLGENPTVADVQAAIKRASGSVDYAKGAGGIVKTTPSEGLVKSVLSGLGDAVDNVEGAAGYTEAKANYAKLSDFVKEGSGYVGKATRDGGFQRSASMAKSAVVSLLNGGKKTWLNELQSLTGEPVLDRAALAIKAMSDAGSAQGKSLLDILNGGQAMNHIPNILDVPGMAISAGKNLFLGSQYDQTMAFLKSLQKNITQ